MAFNAPKYSPFAAIGSTLPAKDSGTPNVDSARIVLGTGAPAIPTLRIASA